MISYLIRQARIDMKLGSTAIAYSDDGKQDKVKIINFLTNNLNLANEHGVYVMCNFKPALKTTKILRLIIKSLTKCKEYF